MDIRIKHSAFFKILSHALLFLFAIGVLYPWVAVMAQSWGQWSVAEFLSMPVLSVVRFSLKLIAATLLGSGLLAMMLVGIAHLSASRSQFFGKNALVRVWSIPNHFPAMLVAMIMLQLLGHSGVLTGILKTTLSFSFQMIVIAQVWINGMWLAAQWLEAQSKLDRRYLEVAQLLGANRYQVFLRVVIPSLKSLILKSLFYVYLQALFSFALVLWLGKGPPEENLPLALYTVFKSSGYQMKVLWPYLSWLFLLAWIPWLLVERYGRSPGFTQEGPLDLSTSRGPGQMSLTNLKNLVSFGLLSAGVILPMMVFLGRTSLQKSYRFFLDPDVQAMLQVQWMLSVSTVIWLVALTLSLYFLISGDFFKKILLSLLNATPAMCLGLVVWPWVMPYQSRSVFPWAVLVSFFQAWIFLPYAYRLLEMMVLHRDRERLESARLLGASAWQAWWW
jgi:ABC-type Fe3+ transport system permease subunit